MGAGGSVPKAEDEAAVSGEQPNKFSEIGPTEPDNSAVVVTDATEDVRDAAAAAEENSIPKDENENEADRAARVEAFRM